MKVTNPIDRKILARAPHAASVNSYWSGGSISYYTLYRGGRCIPVSKSPGFPVFVNQTVDLQPGDVLVQTGIFCGKQAYAFISFIGEKKAEVVA